MFFSSRDHTGQSIAATHHINLSVLAGVVLLECVVGEGDVTFRTGEDECMCRFAGGGGETSVSMVLTVLTVDELEMGRVKAGAAGLTSLFRNTSSWSSDGIKSPQLDLLEITVCWRAWRRMCRGMVKSDVVRLRLSPKIVKCKSCSNGVSSIKTQRTDPESQCEKIIHKKLVGEFISF